jgi:hypothetical protein
MSELPTSRPAQSQAGSPVAVHTAPDQLTAELLRGLLEDAGIPAVLAAGDTSAYLGVSPVPCRIMVPAELAPAARRALDQQLGPIDDDQGEHAQPF